MNFNIFCLLSVALFSFLWYHIGRFRAKIDIYTNSPLLNKINRIDIIVTKTDDSFLVHGKNTNEFIIQGKSKEELLEKLAIKFPLTHFMVDHDNMREIGF